MPDSLITIAKDFSPYPGPRYRRDGEFSGEEFRESLLYPKLVRALAENGKVIVVLDDVAGYGSSFLEESFGGLIRRGLGITDIRKSLEIRALTPRFQHHKIRAETYISEAALHKNAS
ncbi:MAG: STAS-like domain-containing protein [Hyphomicrobiales bacterium]|nr:STAS-like domain-containing protein [Hyphomicrobiales bacterium]